MTGGKLKTNLRVPFKIICSIAKRVFKQTYIRSIVTVYLLWNRANLLFFMCATIPPWLVSTATCRVHIILYIMSCIHCIYYLKKFIRGFRRTFIAVIGYECDNLCTVNGANLDFLASVQKCVRLCVYNTPNRWIIEILFIFRNVFHLFHLLTSDLTCLPLFKSKPMNPIFKIRILLLLKPLGN